MGGTFIMDKCPYCLAETRPGDNFCLNCGNPLVPPTPVAVAQQSQPGVSDATVAAPDNWEAALSGGASSPQGCPHPAPTLLAPGLPPMDQAPPHPNTSPP